MGFSLSDYNFFEILEKYNPDTWHFSLCWRDGDSLCTRCLKCQGCLWETCHMRSTFLVPRNCICWSGMCPRYTRLTGRSCVIFIFALRWPDGGLEESSKCLGPTIFFGGLEEKLRLVSRLVASTDAEIAKKISEFVTSYLTELNEDIFKSDTVFDSFHHQAKIFISDRALLAGFWCYGWSSALCLPYHTRLLLLTWFTRLFSLFMVGPSACSPPW